MDSVAFLAVQLACNPLLTSSCAARFSEFSPHQLTHVFWRGDKDVVELKNASSSASDFLRSFWKNLSCWSAFSHSPYRSPVLGLIRFQLATAYVAVNEAVAAMAISTESQDDSFDVGGFDASVSVSQSRQIDTMVEAKRCSPSTALAEAAATAATAAEVFLTMVVGI